MAMKKSTGNSVRVKPVPYIKLPATPLPKPTMRSTAKDKPLTAKQKAAGNKKGLKAANKPTTSKSVDAARAAAAKRALLTPPAKRTAAQKMALRRGGGGLRGVRGGNIGGGGMNWQNK